MNIGIAAVHGGSNGIERYTQVLSTALARRGHVVLLFGWGARPTWAAEQICFVELPPRWPIRRALGPFASALASLRLDAVARSGRLDVVHATYPEHAVGVRTPCVVTAWHPTPSVRARLSTRAERGSAWRADLLYGLNDALAYRTADGVAAATKQAARNLAGRSRQVSWRPPFIADDDVAGQHAAAPARIAMVAASLDIPHKGLTRLLRGFERARAARSDLELVLIGGWAGAVPPLPAGVTTTGLLGRDRLRAVLATCRGVAVPSVWEEFGYVILEALGLGLPVLASPLPVLDGLGDASIEVVDWDDAEGAAAALLRLVRAPVAVLPEACRENAAVPALEALYESIRR